MEANFVGHTRHRRYLRHGLLNWGSVDGLLLWQSSVGSPWIQDAQPLFLLTSTSHKQAGCSLTDSLQSTKDASQVPFFTGLFTLVYRMESRASCICFLIRSPYPTPPSFPSLLISFLLQYHHLSLRLQEASEIASLMSSFLSSHNCLEYWFPSAHTGVLGRHI